MARFKKLVEGENGWCAWQFPIMKGYKMACCDCGLVHNMEFVVTVIGNQKNGTFTAQEVKSNQFRVKMRAKRNNRSTAAIRRHKEAK